MTGVLLTLKDTWLTREVYQQLLFGALPESLSKIHLLEPAIIKPVALWSGKQVISTLLLNLEASGLNLTAKGKLGVRMWKIMGDGFVAMSKMASNVSVESYLLWLLQPSPNFSPIQSGMERAQSAVPSLLLLKTFF